MEFTIQRWAAWAPGIQSAEAWKAWAEEKAWAKEQVEPDVQFVPPLLRRRLSPTSRMAVAAAFACVGREEAGRVRTVFASRHGELSTTTLSLLNSILRGEAISPAGFGLSVHNAASGLFSLAAHNTRPSTALAAGEDTFCSACVEACGILQHAPDESVLVIMGDEELDVIYAPLVPETQLSYALALLLTRPPAGGLGPFRFARGPARGEPAPRPGEPPALSFLRWLISGEARLVLGSGGRTWRWERI